MNRGQPGQPDGKKVFAETKHPIAERLGAGVDRRTRAGFGAVRGEGNATGEKCRAPTPLRGRPTRSAIREKSGSRRPDDGMERVPRGVDVGDLVREKFDYV